jgi:enamine deaminase RidA (YjgF/YER057c/UK114 family)
MPLDRYSTGTRFEALAGYSRAVADKDYVHISGTVGGDPETGEMPENVDDQLMNILAVIEQALAHFGATLEDVTRTRVYITSMDVLLPVAAALRARFGTHPPANTTLICGIPAAGAKVEIEAIARRPISD